MSVAGEPRLRRRAKQDGLDPFHSASRLLHLRAPCALDAARKFTVACMRRFTNTLAHKLEFVPIHPATFKYPFGDLLVGVTAQELGFSVLTVNLRQFRLIPGLQIKQL